MTDTDPNGTLYGVAERIVVGQAVAGTNARTVYNRTLKLTGQRDAAGGNGAVYQYTIEDDDLTTSDGSKGTVQMGLGIDWAFGSDGTKGAAQRYASYGGITLKPGTSISRDPRPDTEAHPNELVGGAFYATVGANSNMGGTAGHSWGAVFGQFAQAHVQAGASHLMHATGEELDIFVESGATVDRITGTLIGSRGGARAVPQNGGRSYDAYIALGRFADGGPGRKYGLLVSDLMHPNNPNVHPFGNGDGAVIAGIGNGSVQHVIDFHDYNITGSIVRTKKVEIAGHGDARFDGTIYLGAAPGTVPDTKLAIKGTSADNSAHLIKGQNSSGHVAFEVRNDGRVVQGLAGTQNTFYGAGGAWFSDSIGVGTPKQGASSRIVTQGTTNDASANLFVGFNLSGGGTVCIRNNGTVQNATGVYSSFSDIRLKQNVEDTAPKLDDLCRVRVVNYELKSNPGEKLLGVIAQELEEVFPGLVEESPTIDAEGNTETVKTVKYSVFVPMLIKAMQEQQFQIDALSQRLATLEAA